ncbi:MAG: cupin domain-containing protein [Candidatus Omnitrophica bacterium]|nr:cupin domain-containing protein [Candidatus Omnitrophota bacterium]
MSRIQINPISEEKKKALKIPVKCENTSDWSVWECKPSKFDWHYDSKEVAYVYEGKVKVKTSVEEVEISSGDLVTFPSGLSCSWEVIEKIRKVYKFE